MTLPLPLATSMTSDVPLGWFLTLGLFMFVVGGVGVVVRRNPVVVFMCIELMLNAVNLTFLAFARYQIVPGASTEQAALNAMNGQMMVIFVMAVAAAEVAVGLGIIMAIFRLRNEADLDDMSALRG
ncbi:MAG: NADH-quinone oxidoreductase subunit NuoK [Fimbriimonadaceae bacterium]|nr:NADH-quinone oxidoreductase subunit NuoK [Fimbriimonadaceae bacterium]QYK57748.1 MAG: NADH-quinone oxidoreductase subunit NuoK [Fimbriimonadaceae bacterium]